MESGLAETKRCDLPLLERSREERCPVGLVPVARNADLEVRRTLRGLDHDRGGRGSGAGAGVDPLHLRRVLPTEAPRRDHEGGHGEDRDQGENDRARLTRALTSLSPTRRLRREPELGIVFGADVARVVLVDVEVAVEAQRIGVRAKEPLGVRVSRQLVEALFLEEAQILGTHLRALLHLVERKSLSRSCFS